MSSSDVVVKKRKAKVVRSETGTPEGKRGRGEGDQVNRRHFMFSDSQLSYNPRGYPGVTFACGT